MTFNDGIEVIAKPTGRQPVLAELAGMSARATAAELNKRNIETPNGGPWYATTVIRVQNRLTGMS